MASRSGGGRQEVVGINPTRPVYRVRLRILRRRLDAEARAGGLKRFSKQRADILFDDPLGRCAHTLRFPHGLEHRRVDLHPAADFKRTSPSKEQGGPAAVLPIGKPKRALFAQRIAAIAGQHMDQIMRIPRALTIPFQLIAIGWAADAFRFLDQTGRRKPFTAHKRHISMGN